MIDYDKVPEAGDVPPFDHSQQYVSLEQAAFIMQETPNTLIEWIDKGLMLSYKARSVKGDETRNFPEIHQSELDRFLHPWKHVRRLDDRINAQQQKVDILTKKFDGDGTINHMLSSHASRIYHVEKGLEAAEACIDGSETSLRAEIKYLTLRHDALSRNVDRLIAVVTKIQGNLERVAKLSQGDKYGHIKALVRRR
jgi:hypothetical protein